MANVIFMPAIWRERHETQLKTARAVFKSGAVTRTRAQGAAGFMGWKFHGAVLVSSKPGAGPRKALCSLS
jgi:hypothetical protein